MDHWQPAEVQAILSLLDDEAGATIALVKAQLTERGRDAVEALLQQALGNSPGAVAELSTPGPMPKRGVPIPGISSDTDTDIARRGSDTDTNITPSARAATPTEVGPDGVPISRRVRRHLRELARWSVLDGYQAAWEALFRPPSYDAADVIIEAITEIEGLDDDEAAAAAQPPTDAARGADASAGDAAAPSDPPDEADRSPAWSGDPCDITQPPDLYRGALLITRLEHPLINTADIDFALERLTKAVEAALPEALGLAIKRGESVAPSAATDVLNTLTDTLGGRFGLRGTTVQRFYNPSSYCLGRVLATGRGAPIALAAVYMLVGARLGLPIRGVGAPGHFVIALAADDQGQAVLTGDPAAQPDPMQLVYADPFHGRVLDHGALLAFLRASGFTAQPEQLVPAPNMLIMTRWLLNLHRIYTEKGDAERRCGIETAQRVVARLGPR